MKKSLWVFIAACVMRRLGRHRFRPDHYSVVTVLPDGTVVLRGPSGVRSYQVPPGTMFTADGKANAPWPSCRPGMKVTGTESGLASWHGTDVMVHEELNAEVVAKAGNSMMIRGSKGVEKYTWKEASDITIVKDGKVVDASAINVGDRITGMVVEKSTRSSEAGRGGGGSGPGPRSDEEGGARTGADCRSGSRSGSGCRLRLPNPLRRKSSRRRPASFRSWASRVCLRSAPALVSRRFARTARSKLRNPESLCARREAGAFLFSAGRPCPRKGAPAMKKTWISLLALTLAVGLSAACKKAEMSDAGKDATEAAKDAGQAAKEAGEEAAEAAKEGAAAASDAAKDAGAATADAAKDAGKAVGDAAKDAGDATADAAKKTADATADAARRRPKTSRRPSPPSTEISPSCPCRRMRVRRLFFDFRYSCAPCRAPRSSARSAPRRARPRRSRAWWTPEWTSRG